MPQDLPWPRPPPLPVPQLVSMVTGIGDAHHRVGFRDTDTTEENVGVEHLLMPRY